MFKAKALLVALAMVNAPAALADWVLENDSSSINFLSVKNASVVETHRFSALQGTLSDSGKAHVVISLASVDTNIDIRDERMRTMLFNTDLFPSAILDAQLDQKQLEVMQVGQTTVLPVSFTLELHGQQQTLETNLQITKVENGDLLANSLQPVVVDAAKFKLDEGVEALREVAKLNTIVPSVPVYVSLHFKNTQVPLDSDK